MADATRVLAGLDEFEVTGAVETAAGVLEVSVRVARPDAACVRCGTFSCRVKEYRTCRVRDGLSYERPTTLVVTKRRFRCDTPGCVGSFTESTGEVGAAVPGDCPVARGDGPSGVGSLNGCGGADLQGSWSTAWRAIAAAARAKIPGLPPRRLGIDETTFRRHGSFVTGLVDLDTSRLWDLIEGRSKKVLVARLAALGEGVSQH